MAADGPVVTTPLGQLKGTVCSTEKGETIYCFQGIPYGQPPVGDLRFKAPLPVEPWTGVRSAEEAPPMAISTLGIALDAPADACMGESEDCLYLNVYTPQVPRPGWKLPVMVFIHGGGFSGGSGNRAFSGPDYLVPKGVIFVTINYRLGPFGFLSLRTPEYPGNAGLKDQVLGLQWVRDNISAFGGDAGNVTVFGESAGGSSVHYLLLSTSARGLFQRAIAQSGAASNRWAMSRYPVETATLLAKRLGCQGDDKTSVAETLKNASAHDIRKNSAGLFHEIQGEWAAENFLNFAFQPVVEPADSPNPFLTKLPEQAVEDGDYADVPYITGVCADEMILGLKGPDFIPPWDDDVFFQKMLPKELGIPLESPKMKEAAQKLKDFYFPNGSTQTGFIQALTDMVVVRRIFKTVEAQSKDPKKRSPDYLYVLTATRELGSLVKAYRGVSKVPGVCHGDDLEFLFPTNLIMSARPPIAEGTPDNEVKENILNLWTNFAKTGKVPAEWRPAEAATNFPYINIGRTIEPKTGFYSKQMKFWDELYAFLKS